MFIRIKKIFLLFLSVFLVSYKYNLQMYEMQMFCVHIFLPGLSFFQTTLVFNPREFDGKNQERRQKYQFINKKVFSYFNFFIHLNYN